MTATRTVANKKYQPSKLKMMIIRIFTLAFKIFSQQQVVRL